jgi:phage N-6-adenine-methyltransferase
MSPPKPNRGKSEQVVETPPVFVNAVMDTFGFFDYDLAAHAGNAQANIYYEPDAHPSRLDSLAAEWPREGLCWLNPPYADIAPWAQKCATTVTSGSALRILMLVPASVGANWYRDHVAPFADVYSVGRMKFVGHVDQYPKDLILCQYWKLGGGKFRHWSWK